MSFIRRAGRIDGRHMLVPQDRTNAVACVVPAVGTCAKAHRH